MIASKCRQNELGLIVDIVLGRVDACGAVSSSHSALFAAPSYGERVVDPRSNESEAANARFDSDEAAEGLIALWSKQLARLLDGGAAGFRFLDPHHVPRSRWRQLLVGLRERFDAFLAFAWTPGLSWSQIGALVGSDFDGVFSSAAWWDFRARWFVEEYELKPANALGLTIPELATAREVINTDHRLMRCIIFSGGMSGAGLVPQ